ncbi:MAG: hypothetical protein M3Y27_27125 [Acidobacteriota bacterium]|nr:hypothetical protein [Acidobacteriota bacterium]
MTLDEAVDAAPSNSASTDHAGAVHPDLAAVAGSIPYKEPVAVKIPEYCLPSNYYRVKQSAVPIFLDLAKKHIMFIHADTIVEYVEKKRGNGVLKPITPAGFASRLECLGTLVKHVVGKNEKVVRKDSLCSKSSAEILLETAEAREYLPPLAIVSNTPVLVSDMGVPQVLGAGYHSHLDGILITCKSPPHDVPLPEAVQDLVGLFKDFRFETESDLARAMAMVLTISMVDGGLLQGESVPLFVIEADQSQAGKGYLAKIVAAMVKQEPPPLSPRRGGVGGFDEDFDAALLRGHSCVLLDNIRGRIDSTHIESFFTADSEFLCRVPHRPNLPVDARRYVVFLTSNGFQTSPDLENRIIRIRLRKQPEEYYFSQYPEGHLLQRVRKHQHYYHSCVLAVLKNWMLQGFKTTRESRHDFRGWTRPLDWIIRHTFTDAIRGRLLDELHTATTLGSAEKLGFQLPPATKPEP